MIKDQPIHVGGGYLVHPSHPVARIPSQAAVIWATHEGGYVLVSYDIRGHLVARVIPSIGQYLDTSVQGTPMADSFFRIVME